MNNENTYIYFVTKLSKLMFSFFKKNKAVIDVPQWAVFFSDKEYLSFTDAMDKYLKKMSIVYRINNGVIYSENNLFGFNQMGLLNVAQRCKQNRISNYDIIIAEHFNTLIKSNQFKDHFAEIEHDFYKIKEYLGVRLYHKDYFAELGIENIIGENLAGDIYAVLVFDFPDSINNVKPEQAEKWEKHVSELMTVGIDNIREKYELKISEEQLGDFKIWLVQSESFFTPNIVFDLGNRPELSNRNGLLMAFPHRHAVLIYPIRNLEVVKAINSLIPVAYGMCQEGPGSLSSQLFLYKGDILTNIPYKFTDDKIELTPPEEFLELLNSLE